MKTLIAYRRTGADLSYLEGMLSAVRQSFKRQMVDANCTFFDEALFQAKQMGRREIMQHSFKIIDGCDFVFVLLSGEEKSEGMLMEVGYCLAKRIPVVVAVKDGVNDTCLPKMANLIVTWSSQSDLLDKISALDYSWQHHESN